MLSYEIIGCVKKRVIGLHRSVRITSMVLCVRCVFRVVALLDVYKGGQW